MLVQIGREELVILNHGGLKKVDLRVLRGLLALELTEVESLTEDDFLLLELELLLDIGKTRGGRQKGSGLPQIHAASLRMCRLIRGTIIETERDGRGRRYRS